MAAISMDNGTIMFGMEQENMLITMDKDFMVNGIWAKKLEFFINLILIKQSIKSKNNNKK